MFEDTKLDEYFVRHLIRGNLDTLYDLFFDDPDSFVGAPYATYVLPPASDQELSSEQRLPVIYDPDSPNKYPPNLDFILPGLHYKLRPDGTKLSYPIAPATQKARRTASITIKRYF